MFSDRAKELLKATQPDHDRIKSLLASGADFNEIDAEEGETVFSSFVETHHLTITDFISMGARPTVTGARGGHPLIYAVWSLNYGLLRSLLDSGADPNQVAFDSPDDSPMTALDALAGVYHTDADPQAHMVLDAMGELLKQRGGKYAHERSA